MVQSREAGQTVDISIPEKLEVIHNSSPSIFYNSLLFSSGPPAPSQEQGGFLGNTSGKRHLRHVSGDAYR